MSKIPAAASIHEEIRNLNFFKDTYTHWAALTYLSNLRNQGESCVSNNPIPIIFETSWVEYERLLASQKISIFPTTYSNGDNAICTGFVTFNQLKSLVNVSRRLRIGITTQPAATLFRARSAIGINSSKQIPIDDHEVVVGVIDHEVAFAHSGFLTSTGDIRIERFWDQQVGYPVSRPGENKKLAWHTVAKFDYGRELRDRAISRLIRKHGNNLRVYAEQGYPLGTARTGHGTHVMGLAVGKLPGYPDLPDNVKVIAVQLPHHPEKLTSAASLSFHVLEAVRYMIRHAKGRRLIINISDGAYAGPHDGSALLEAAISQHIAEQDGRLAVVVSAGNQFNERVHWQQVITTSNSASMAWRVLPDDKTDSHLELWLSCSKSDENKVSVTWTLPNNMVLGPVALDGGPQVLRNSATQMPIACLMPQPAPLNGNGKALFHLAMCATTQVGVPHGVSKIVINNGTDNDIQVHAWIDRDNIGVGQIGPARQSHFVDNSYEASRRSVAKTPLDDTDNPSPVRHMGALSTLATAADVLVIGGCVASTQALSTYSASGPGRGGTVPGVDLLAISDERPTLPGLLSFGNRPGSWVRLNGTSVAAPQVTRELATKLALNPRMTTHQAVAEIKLDATPVAGPVERAGAGLMA